MGGVILGFLAFAENGYGAFCEENDEFGFAWVNHEKVDDIVADAKIKCNVLIVQVHAGVEEINVPLPEWRKKYKKLVDLGAAAVVAHHPHVPQGWEIYNGAPIFYSLGNFFFDMDSKHPLWNKGIIAKLTVKTTDFQQISVDVLPIEKHDDTVTLSTDQNYLTHLNHLCEILQEPIYSKMVEQELDELWNNRYKSYYLSALNGVEKINIIKLLKFVKRLFMKETIRLELFHHLLFIESHLFAVNAALKQYYKKRN
jgi:poly-gamma-glutamate synthesis protein (capsule biosynthesis protein)